MAKEEVEYESDPEDAKLSLKMRRREASDDEEEGGEHGGEKPHLEIDSDGEFEGAAAEYEDELEEEEEVEDYEDEEEYGGEEIEEEDEVKYEKGGSGKGGDGAEVVAEERAEAGTWGLEQGDLVEGGKGTRNAAIETVNDNVVDDCQPEEEKKEIEPYAVPTAGAFYMHDDRFQDSAGGRHRRMLGGRKLWESKDDRKWGHDKFEQLTMQERHYEEHRSFRGRNQGRGRNRGDRGYPRSKRPRAPTYNRDNNQNSVPKVVRGRGPQRYQPSSKNDTEAPITQNRQLGKSVEKPSYASSGRTSEPVPNAEPDTARPRKQVFASSLSIASPPFYPSGPPTKDNVVPHKRDIQASPVNRNGQPSVVDDNITMVQSSAALRGKNIVDSIGMDKLYINDSHTTMSGKPSNTMQIPLSGSSSISSTQPQLRVQGRGITSSAQMASQSVVSNNQGDRVLPPTQLQTVQKNSSKIRSQYSVQASGQQFTRLPTGSAASSPPLATMPVKSFEPGELETPSDSSKSKTALVAKGKGSVQGTGRGSFLYNVGPSGNMGSVHGDQNFPAFLPVMQFGSQRPGGIGVPAVGMAFPGYVAQSQLGVGNSEMTWLPVLAGAAGAMGGTYCSPYLAVDGSYNSRSSGQTISVVPSSSFHHSKENNATTDSADRKPAHRTEPANDEFGQRQKNPRRYTEMKFDR